MVRRWPEPAQSGDLLEDLRADAAVMGPAMGVGEASCEAVRSAAGQGASEEERRSTDLSGRIFEDRRLMPALACIPFILYAIATAIFTAVVDGLALHGGALAAASVCSGRGSSHTFGGAPSDAAGANTFTVSAARSGWLQSLSIAPRCRR